MGSSPRSKGVYLGAVVVLGVMLLLSARPVGADLPPRPARPIPIGALIELRAQFDLDWVWAELPWSDMDTEVQWQDDLGDWHVVEGWRGEFDQVVGYEGRKSWWLPQEHFGTGPFRWVLYAKRGGQTLAVSQPFFLPSGAGRVARIVLAVNR